MTISPVAASFILEAHHKLSNEVIVYMFAEFVTMCNVTPVDSLTIDEAIASRFSGFEDAMHIIQPSVRVPMPYAIITRNSSDSTPLKSKSMSRNSSLICLRKNKQEGNALPRPQA